jgi:hypothetical protein
LSRLDVRLIEEGKLAKQGTLELYPGLEAHGRSKKSLKERKLEFWMRPAGTIVYHRRLFWK